MDPFSTAGFPLDPTDESELLPAPLHSRATRVHSPATSKRSITVPSRITSSPELLQHKRLKPGALQRQGSGKIVVPGATNLYAEPPPLLVPKRSRLSVLRRVSDTRHAPFLCSALINHQRGAAAAQAAIDASGAPTGARAGVGALSSGRASACDGRFR